ESDVTSAFTGTIIKRINENTESNPIFVLTKTVFQSSLLKNTYNLFYGFANNNSQILQIK
ncbi:MAG: hypothetical protein ACE5RK_06465, partial [Candidatus Nitrosomaritimum aestuariumsis]